jgi:poly-gamma-glutamate capsule biosynthesis protein CapA/YwtB (metallophosphatase superfamily)
VATLIAVGDTAPYIEPAESIFDNVADFLAGATWRFAQVERTFSARGTYREDAQAPNSRVKPHLASAYKSAGFDAVSLASNHSGDWGADAFLDTVDTFRDLGIKTAGAGRTIDEAREPVILEADGVRVAILAYCSVLLPIYWAGPDRPGVAPLRAETYYLPYEYQPGTPVQVRTVPLAEDIAGLERDIRAAKQRADFVMVSCHWGVHFAPRTVPDYECEVAKVAAAAGCDIIVGHGPHMLRGVEVVDGMPCLHSVGNFVMSKPSHHRSFAAPEGRFQMSEIYSIDVTPDFTYRHSQWGHLGVAACLEFTKGQPVSVKLRPSTTDDHPRAIILPPDDPRFKEVAEFVAWSSEPLGGREHLSVQGDAIVIER